MRLAYYFFLLLILVPGANTFAQKMGFKSTTRAVVVGISNYQDETIPDLKFAHKDAEAFVNYLTSQAGGGLQSNQIVKLVNEQATIAQIYSALDWLIDESSKNDRVIIYLSGHGDVETKTIRQRGYFLAYDSPPNNYRIGAVRLEDLNDVIATVSQSNQSKVLVVSDACRSGKLAGSGIDGPNITASAFSAQYANELKILSCQPNEFSLEGQQWGGGRGVFSYHLIDGLIGLADANHDAVVNLREIERYLEDKVAREAMPQNQNPMAIGNKLSMVSVIDDEQLLALKEEKEGMMAAFGIAGSRATAFQNTEGVDSTIVEMYALFNQSLEDQYFLPRDLTEERIAGQSAEELYDVLIEESSLAEFHNLMKRNFAAALQDVAQQSLNAYLRADLAEMQERFSNYGKSYEANPQYLAKAAELLGPEHFIYEQIKTKQYYFEGLIQRLEAQRLRKANLYNLAFEKVDTALSYDDQAAYVYNELGLISSAINQPDDAEEYYQQAMNLAPTWVLPVSNMFTVEKLRKNNDLAVEWAERAIELDSTYIAPYYNLGLIYKQSNDLQRAKEMFAKTIQIDDRHFRSHLNLGLMFEKQDSIEMANYHYLRSVEIDPNYYLGHYNSSWTYIVLNKLDSAEHHINRALVIHPSNIDAKDLKGYIHYKKGEYDIAEEWFLNAIAQDSNYVYAPLDLADMYLSTERQTQALSLLNKLQNTHPDQADVYFHLARASAQNGDSTEALQRLELAFQKGFEDKKVLDEQGDFDNLRSLQGYLDLISTYFE